MDPLTNIAYEELARSQGGMHVSVYLPTHPASPDQFEDKVRLKTLLDEADSQLALAGMTPQQIKEMLQDARDLLERESFWHDRERGLAIFIDRDHTRAYRMPIPCPARASVSDRFITRYLLPLIQLNQSFFLLTLSRHGAKLFRGTPFTLDELVLSKMPANVEQSLSIESADRGSQVHSSGLGVSSSRKQRAVFHGHGGERDADLRQFHEYLRAIWQALEPELADSELPLVIAGVDYEVAEFKTLCRYRHIVEQSVSGNPSLLKLHELREKAWQLVEQQLAAADARALDRFQQLAGTGRTSQEIAEIVLAANSGDIDTLIVAHDLQCWGHFDAAAERVIIHHSAQPLDHDLVDESITKSYLAKGRIVFNDRIKTISSSGLGAIYRKGRVPRAPRLVGESQRDSQPATP